MLHKIILLFIPFLILGCSYHQPIVSRSAHKTIVADNVKVVVICNQPKKFFPDRNDTERKKEMANEAFKRLDQKTE